MTKEGKVKKKVKEALDAMGAYYFSPQAGAFGRAGIPDIVGCIKGRFFAIECKAGDNTTTALQEKEIAKIRAVGGIALVINEKNLDAIKEVLWVM